MLVVYIRFPFNLWVKALYFGENNKGTDPAQWCQKVSVIEMGSGGRLYKNPILYQEERKNNWRIHGPKWRRRASQDLADLFGVFSIILDTKLGEY